MLTKLILRNFQNHEKKKLIFDRYVTTIIGRSDSGKSAIVRALRWLCLNEPSGEAFKRTGADYVRVTLFIGGCRVARERGTENLYWINKSEFKSFGSNVPDPVSKLLNIGDTNFQLQHDSPYWLSDSGGQASRNLNSIINLGVIDSSMARIASALRSATNEVELASTALKRAKTDRSVLEWVEDLDVKLGKLEEFQDRLTKKRLRLDLLHATVRRVKRAESIVRTAQPVIESGSELVKWGSVLIKRGDRLNKLAAVLAKLKSLQERQTQCQREKEATERTIRENIGEICPLCGSPTVKLLQLS